MTQPSHFGPRRCSLPNGCDAPQHCMKDGAQCTSSNVGAPNGWIAFKEGRAPLHLSKADGWTVEPVTFEPNNAAPQGSSGSISGEAKSRIADVPAVSAPINAGQQVPHQEALSGVVESGTDSRPKARYEKGSDTVPAASAPTPETDAVILSDHEFWTTENGKGCDKTDYDVLGRVARNLERQRDAALARLKEAERLLSQWLEPRTLTEMLSENEMKTRKHTKDFLDAK